MSPYRCFETGVLLLYKDRGLDKIYYANKWEYFRKDERYGFPYEVSFCLESKSSPILFYENFSKMYHFKVFELYWKKERKKERKKKKKKKKEEEEE